MPKNRHPIKAAGSLFFILALGMASTEVIPDALPAKSAPSAQISPLLRLMQEKIIPASSLLFEAGAEAPTDLADWQNLEAAADILRLSALDLAELPPEVPPGASPPAADSWRNFSAAFAEAAQETRLAVASRDADALSTASDRLYQRCEACHLVYLPPTTVAPLP
jgi:hypothetical protein